MKENAISDKLVFLTPVFSLKVQEIFLPPHCSVAGA